MEPGNHEHPGTPFTTIRQRLLTWYQRHARSLPWRATDDPYAILVAEVMLQQTQVARVVPKYHEFLSLFPTLEALAQASIARVIQAWAPLGYNRRAVHLHRAARQVVMQHGGALPREPESLQKLSGIGRYTAAAVACFAFGADVPVLDTNVRRVLGRLLYGVRATSEAEARSAASRALPRGQAAAWNQALMDLGATVCTSRYPDCPHCPLQEHCLAAPLLQPTAARVAERRQPYQAPQPPFRGSRRYYRGRIIHHLRSLEEGAVTDLQTLGAAVYPGFQGKDLPWLAGLLEALARDGLASLHYGEPADAYPIAASLPGHVPP